MNTRLTVSSVLIAAIVLTVVYSQCTFVVQQNQIAIKVAANDEVVKTDYQPGLQFIIPALERVHVFDKRVVTHNFPEERFQSSEGQILRMNYFAQWQITDVAAYYKATTGDENVIVQRLADPIRVALKEWIAKRTLQQAVALGHTDFANELSNVVASNATTQGIKLVDVRIQKMALPESYNDSVYAGMQSSFRQSAAQLRAEGEAKSREIMAQADRERDVILANAKRDSAITRGEGDAKAAAIYSTAYGRNTEFYSFYRSMQAYRESLGKTNDVLVISPDNEFFKYLNKSGVR